MSIGAYIGRAFSIDPVAALRGSELHVATRLAAADAVVVALGGERPSWYADGMGPGGEE